MAGCPIPAEGADIILAICLPDTWAGMISNLLVPPTELPFWDDSASLSDREAAQRQAATIVGQFHSDECACADNCDPYPPSNHEQVFDFTADPYGWVPNPDLCQQTDGVGMESIKFYNPFGYWTKAVEISFTFPSPYGMPTQIYVQGNGSTIQYPTNGPQTFPYSEIYLWATDGSYPIMQARTTYGLSGLPVPLWATWEGLPRTLASSVVIVYHAGNYLVEQTADQAYAVIEQVRMVWND